MKSNRRRDILNCYLNNMGHNVLVITDSGKSEVDATMDFSHWVDSCLGGPSYMCSVTKIYTWLKCVAENACDAQMYDMFTEKIYKKYFEYNDASSDGRPLAVAFGSYCTHVSFTKHGSLEMLNIAERVAISKLSLPERDRLQFFTTECAEKSVKNYVAKNFLRPIYFKCVHMPTFEESRDGFVLTISPAYFYGKNYDLFASSIRTFVQEINATVFSGSCVAKAKRNGGLDVELNPEVSPSDLKIDYAPFFNDMFKNNVRIWIPESEVDAFVEDFPMLKGSLKVVGVDENKVAEYEFGELTNNAMGTCLADGTATEHFPKRNLMTFMLALDLELPWEFADLKKRWRGEASYGDYLLIKDGYITKDDLKKIDIYAISTLDNGSGDKIAFTSAGLVYVSITDTDMFRAVFFSDAETFINGELSIPKTKTDPWGELRSTIEVYGLGGTKLCSEVCTHDTTTRRVYAKVFGRGANLPYFHDGGWSLVSDPKSIPTSICFEKGKAGVIWWAARIGEDRKIRYSEICTRLFKLCKIGYKMPKSMLTFSDCPEVGSIKNEDRLYEVYKKYVFALASISDLDAVYPFKLCLDKEKAIAELCGVSE